MKNDASAKASTSATSAPYLGALCGHLHTGAAVWEAGYVVNAAGLYADRVARDFGFSKDYRVLPFQGIYLYSMNAVRSASMSIPCPISETRFLGVHFTLLAMPRQDRPHRHPAFWREQYHAPQQFSIGEFAETSSATSPCCSFPGFDFKRLAVGKLSNYLPPPPCLTGVRKYWQDVQTRNTTAAGQAGIPGTTLEHQNAQAGNGFRSQGDQNPFARANGRLARVDLTRSPSPNTLRQNDGNVQKSGA